MRPQLSIKRRIIFSLFLSNKRKKNSSSKNFEHLRIKSTYRILSVVYIIYKFIHPYRSRYLEFTKLTTTFKLPLQLQSKFQLHLNY